MRFLSLLLFVCVFCAGSSAQSFQPKAITFTGASGFEQAELLRASGLAAGKPLSTAEIQAGTQRLADTGIFTDVRYRFDSTTPAFSVTPNPAVLPVRFANFAWWSEAGLKSAIAARVPLFHGAVPLSGTLQEQVSQALVALLAERGVPSASIEAMPQSDEGSSELRAITYRISQPAVVVGAVSFSGAGSEWAPMLDRVAASLAGKEYTGTDTQKQLREAVLHVYRSKGYAAAAVLAAQPGAPTVEGGRVLVPLTASVVAGEQFRLGSFSLAGSTLLDQPGFLKAALLKPGEVAEEDKLRLSLLLVTGPYAAKGYMDAKVSAEPTFHASEHTVDYAIRVTPGEPYRMGQLTMRGLDDARMAAVEGVWSLKPGEPFDASYPPSFLRKNASKLHALDGYSASYRQIKHLDTHVVDLEVTFKKDSSLGGM